LTLSTSAAPTSDIAWKPINLKWIIWSALAFWLTLICWSLSSPLGTTPDEHYHIASIWCAEGVKNPSCPAIPENSDRNLVAIPDLSNVCFREVACPQQDQHLATNYRITQRNYPSAYYRSMHKLVGPNMTQSILVMRVFNSTIASLLFFSQAILCTNKKYLSWLTGFTFTIIPLGMSLIASINPSGWAFIGIANSWMFLLIATSTPNVARFRKLASWALWAFSSFLCIASRFDATIFLVITNLVVLIANYRSALRVNRRFVIGIGAISVLSFPLWRGQFHFLQFTSGWRTTPLNAGGPDLHIWITHWIINVISIPIDAFGEGRLGQEMISIPRMVPIFGVGFLSAALLFSVIQINRRQVFSVGASFLFMAIVVIRISNLELDLFNVSGRYILPLVPYIVGCCIYFSSSPLQLMEVLQLRRIIIACMTIIHALSMYAVVEQNVMGTSFGIQILKVGTEEWWWTKSPIGPNFLIVIGSFFFYQFISHAWDRVPIKTFSVQPQNFQS